MQTGIYIQDFPGLDLMPLTAGTRAQLLREVPPSFRCALLALLRPAQGQAEGDVVILLRQLGDVPRETKPRTQAAKEGKEWQERKANKQTKTNPGADVFGASQERSVKGRDR